MSWTISKKFEMTSISEFRNGFDFLWHFEFRNFEMMSKNVRRKQHTTPLLQHCRHSDLPAHHYYSKAVPSPGILSHDEIDRFISVHIILCTKPRWSSRMGIQNMLTRVIPPYYYKQQKRHSSNQSAGRCGRGMHAACSRGAPSTTTAMKCIPIHRMHPRTNTEPVLPNRTSSTEIARRTWYDISVSRRLLSFVQHHDRYDTAAFPLLSQNPSFFLCRPSFYTKPRTILHQLMERKIQSPHT